MPREVSVIAWRAEAWRLYGFLLLAAFTIAQNAAAAGQLTVSIDIAQARSFGVSIPRAGDYYLILDNRQGEEPRKIRLLIRAEKPKTPGNAPARPDAAKSRETRI